MPRAPHIDLRDAPERETPHRTTARSSGIEKRPRSQRRYHAILRSLDDWPNSEPHNERENPRRRHEFLLPSTRLSLEDQRLVCGLRLQPMSDAIGHDRASRLQVREGRLTVPPGNVCRREVTM